MTADQWFEDVPVLSQLSPDRAAAVLRDIGEVDAALALEQPSLRQDRRSDTFGIFDFLSSAQKPWMHSAHTFGFLPQRPARGREREIFPAGEIETDETLCNSRIKISLNRLRVAAYPGGGTHNILFDFYARNQLANGSEDVHYNSVLRVNEGSDAGVVGYPVFLGLGVGPEGVSFKCFTVNVKNEEDEKFLSVLDSRVFKQGLLLATIAQPALGPLSELAVGLTKYIAMRHRNVPVQSFQMGLDFAGTRMGARLAQGDYIAVQIPMDLRRIWRWSEWEYDAESGQIVNPDDGTYIPFNYIVFGITKYVGK